MNLINKINYNLPMKIMNIIQRLCSCRDNFKTGPKGLTNIFFLQFIFTDVFEIYLAHLMYHSNYINVLFIF